MMKEISTCILLVLHCLSSYRFPIYSYAFTLPFIYLWLIINLLKIYHILTDTCRYLDAPANTDDSFHYLLKEIIM